MRNLFSNKWVSVRKAFLDLDFDHDGEISAEDILIYFGGGSRFIDFDDLEKILKDLSTNKKGTLSYNDFCRWMGNAIQVCSGLYFRHDSKKNPEFEEH